ncbi:MAG: cupin domain-containing protein [Phycisphaerae bacterium]|jgi:quercetin dioxygenase-like cupin family protein
MSESSAKLPGIEPRIVCGIADLASYNDDSIVSRTLMNANSGSLTLFAFAEGQHLSEHTCPYDACAHVLDGAAEIVIGGELFEIGAGQMILMPAHVPHAVYAPRSFKMLLTMFKVGSKEP